MYFKYKPWDKDFQKNVSCFCEMEQNFIHAYLLVYGGTLQEGVMATIFGFEPVHFYPSEHWDENDKRCDYGDVWDTPWGMLVKDC